MTGRKDPFASVFGPGRSARDYPPPPAERDGTGEPGSRLGMSRVVSRVQMATPGKGDYTHVVIEKSVNPPFPRELEAAVFDFFHVFKRTVKTMVMHPDTADKLRESEWHVPAARGRPPRFEYAITFATIVRDPHMSRNLIELRG